MFCNSSFFRFIELRKRTILAFHIFSSLHRTNFLTGGAVAVQFLVQILGSWRWGLLGSAASSSAAAGATSASATAAARLLDAAAAAAIASGASGGTAAAASGNSA